MSGGSIEAILTLNASSFITGLETSETAVKNFVAQVEKTSGGVSGFRTAIDGLLTALRDVTRNLSEFTKLAKETESFNKFANGVKALATAVQTLGTDTASATLGMTRVLEIIRSMEGIIQPTTIKIETLSNALSKLGQSESKVSSYKSIFKEMQQDLMNMANAISSTARLKEQMASMNAEFERSREELLRFAQSGVQVSAEVDKIVNANVRVKEQLASMNAEFERSRAELLKVAQGLNQLQKEEGETANSTNRATQSIQRQNVAFNQGVGSANRLTTATSSLGRAMSSLRMIGTMVASMFVWNFASSLVNATRETVNAKSEMEGYFQMLHFTTSQVDDFNRALDETIKKFPRLNKYSLGETISSIGVEFELTTEEMKKAMPVVSMITSEYLRAGRNTSEASLAVKDILQGEFQRLSRETGVKGDQLKEAGWSGDKTDVMGLLDALKKVGESRNWDTFVAKANSLNDAVLILQNRFGEWSADMVNAVQPAILNAFNSIMNFAEGLSQSISGLWQWLNGGSWEATATQIGFLSSAILVASQGLLMYRANVGLVEASQMGLTKAIASVVLGMKGEELANIGVRNAIMSKILGVNAEKVAESGVASAISQKLTMMELETVQTQLNSLASTENSTVNKALAIEKAILKAEEEGLIASTEAETLVKQLNTIMTEEQTVANGGLIASLYLLGTGEAIVTGETSALAIAWGVLNGVIALSPIGWITLAILGLASAFYVLTGGLDESFNKMKDFNETMKDTGSAQNEAHKWLLQYTDAHKDEADAVQRANDEYDDYVHNLQSASYWYQHSQTAFNGLDLTAETTGKGVLEKHGISKEDAREWNNNVDSLVYGKNQYYKAEQVLNKQIKDENSNYARDLDKYLTDVQKTGGDLEDAYAKMTGNYENLAKHSYIANTSEDWWERSWNQLYAGFDQFWIDWDMRWAKAGTGDWIGAFFGEDAKTQLKDFSKDWDETWKWFNDSLANLQDMGRDFLEPLNGIGDEFNKFMADPLGYLGVQKHLDNVWKDIVDPLIKGFSQDLPNYINESLGHWSEVFGGIGKWATDGINYITSLEWLPQVDFNIIDELFKMIGLDPAYAENGESHPEVGEEMYQVIVQPIVDWWNGFMADPLSYIGASLEYTGIGQLISALMGVTDGMDFSWASEWVNNNIILPITTTIQTFMSDPVAFIGDMGFSITGLLDSIFPTNFEGTWAWVNEKLIQPMNLAIYNGIMSIPILGDILSMLGFVDQAQGTSSEKGRTLAQHFQTALEDKIRSIPILGDILTMLGVIPQSNGDAYSKGHGVGENIKKGEKEGHTGLADNIRTEMGNVITILSQKAGEAYKVAHDIGNQILNGIKNALDMHSPSIISRELIANEFGVYIPQAISDNGALAYETAQGYGQQIYDGINSVQTVLGFGDMVEGYESDAQIIATTSETMGLDTTTAFNNMTLAVTDTTNSMQGNVVSSYTTMQQKQNTLLNNMKTSNTTAYNEMYTKSNQSLLQMRTSTENITQQMTKAWIHMKDQIVATANKLKTDSTAHFNQLSETIGSFYRKIQNPSNWGSAGSPEVSSGRRNVRAGRSFASAIRGRGYAGGLTSRNSTTPTSTMTISQLKKLICPSGECDNIFDGYNATDRVNVQDFLSSVGGDHGFGWNDWSGTHYNYIKNKSDQWSMKSPVIQLMGGIPTDAQFKVGEFNNGTPRISFSEFQSMAGSIFSRIPYRLYFDSSWKGSWLGALQSGACNCYDGASALLAFARTCGFDGYMAHGSWNGIGHVWAVINGVPMDTTAWQGGYGWTSPKVHGYGSPDVMRPHHTPSYNESNAKVVNITVDMSNSVVYGVDDLDDRIKGATKEAMREEFNDPYGVAL